MNDLGAEITSGEGLALQYPLDRFFYRRLTYRCGMTAVALVTLENQIAGVMLNRPDRLNAIDGSLIDAMDDVMDVLGTASSARPS
jgi:hypothetical protein